MLRRLSVVQGLAFLRALAKSDLRWPYYRALILRRRPLLAKFQPALARSPPGVPGHFVR